jgi:hypothetical protein
MPDEPESRLRELFARLPTASRAVEDRALAAALAALPVAGARRRRPVRTALLVAATAVCLLAVSAGALGAAGALHVSLGENAKTTHVRASVEPRLLVPRGARGIVAVVDGRLWFTSRTGLRIEGLPVESAALSPHAMYIAAGIGDSLVVMAPNGTQAWSHAAGGRVVAIAWAPSGLRIAYVVQKTAGGMQLRTIEGDGDHDRVLDAAVRPVTPSWRADALAVAYVGAGGHPVVYDFSRRAHRVVGDGRMAGATRVAFAPHGRALAVASAAGLQVAGPRGAWVGDDFGRRSVAGIAWAGNGIAVALDAPSTRGLGLSVVQVFGSQNGALVHEKPVAVRGRITALGTVGSRLVFALRRHGAQTQLLGAGDASGLAPQVLLTVGSRSTVGELAVR